MKAAFLSGAACVLTALLSYAPRDRAPTTAEQTASVVLELSKNSYRSCEVVTLRVRNVSRERISVEASVEDLEDGSWTAAWCQYNLLDPGGRLVKRFRPRPIEPRGTLAVRYDRCSDYALCVKPKFPKTPSQQLRQSLEKEDARATAPVSQRIWVDVYAGSGASLKDKGRSWSQPFTRTPQAP